MNKLYFNDIVKGKFGRKIAYTDYETVTKDNIVDIVASCIGTFNYNKTVIEYLWDYVHGDQPVLYRTKKVRDDILNKVCENHAWEIVRFKNQQTYGEPLQYVSRTNDEEKSRYVETLINYMIDANKHARDIESGEWQSAVGTSFKAVQINPKSDVPFRIVVLSPLNTFVIYNRGTKEPLVSVQECRTTKGERFLMCYTETNECKIVDSHVYEWKLHGFGGNPIVEYPNNPERISDIELVISMLDAINDMDSNRIDSIGQFVQSWIKFVNCQIDEETFEKMKLMGALVVKSNNADNKADVDIMSQELNQTQTQVAKDDLLNNIYSILAIPNKEGNTGGDTQGAVELRNGWDFSKGAAKLKDPIVIESERRLFRCILNIIRIYKGDCPLTTRDFDIRIHHSPLDNMLVKAQFLDYLLKDGVHPKIAFERSTLFPDSEKAFIMSKPYLDVIYKESDSDVEDLQKRANLFTSLMNAGSDADVAAKISGIDKEIADGKNIAKWNYEETEDN